LKKHKDDNTEKKKNVLFHQPSKDTQMYQTFDFTQRYNGENEEFYGQKTSI